MACWEGCLAENQHTTTHTHIRVHQQAIHTLEPKSDCIWRPQCHSAKQQKHCCLCQLTRVDQLNCLKNDCRCRKASPEDSFGERPISGVCLERESHRTLLKQTAAAFSCFSRPSGKIGRASTFLFSPLIFHSSLCQSLMIFSTP